MSHVILHTNTIITLIMQLIIDKKCMTILTQSILFVVRIGYKPAISLHQVPHATVTDDAGLFH